MSPTFTNKIAFLACPAGFNCQTSNLGLPGDVYVVGADGTGLTRLTFDDPQPYVGPWYSRPIASPDGTTVAFGEVGPFQYDRLFLINADGTARRELILPVAFVNYLTLLSFSPDSSQIAFYYSDNSGITIATINADGTGFRILVDNPIGSTLSADWTTLAGSDINGSVVVIKMDGTSPHVLDSGRVYGGPSITYDGSQIAYARFLGPFFGQYTDVYVINGDGSQPHSVANTPAVVDPRGNLVFSFSPSISQNGSTVAFFSDADLVPGKNSDLNYEVFVAVLRPGLGIDGGAVSTRRRGETFTFTGFGFTHDQLVTRRVRQPDGSEVTLEPMTATGSGELSWAFPTASDTPTGTYRVWVVDEATGKISNIVDETINP
jgi:Tol biopolymer transport system component